MRRGLQFDRRRRCRLGVAGAVAFVWATPLFAQSHPPATPRFQISSSLPAVVQDAFLETRTFALHEGESGSASVTAFTPQYGRQTGAAIIVAPGGGYISLAGSLEGRQVADWFAARGFTAFVLRYRHGGAHRLPDPIEDGERAIRFVRAHAQDLGVDPDRIGMIGFSAGGHLAAMTTAGSDPGQPGAIDPVEQVSSRPDFLVLGYPWLRATTVDQRGTSPYCMFARIARWDCKAQDYSAYTPLPALTEKAPPTFIYHTTDDELVPVAGSIDLYSALVEAKVDAEMHLFAHGSHGSGLGGNDPALTLWPQALDAWLRARGYFSRPTEGGAP